MSAKTHPPGGKEQRLLRNARRESVLILAAWAVCLVWSVGVSTLFGYAANRDPADIALILGFPDWVFWGVVVPWGVGLIFATWFCFGFMADDDLGKDMAEGPGHG
jgi:hypothetical protein